MKRKLISLVLAVCMVVSAVCIGVVPAAADDAPAYETYAQNTVDGSVILHCFCWPYNAIKAALPDIARAGYTAVQTSPVQSPKDYDANNTTTEDEWWKLYQPLGFTVSNNSWLGTKAELTSLCAEAENYNIKVIVDVVANHLANNGTSGGTLDNLHTDVESYYRNSDYIHSESYKSRDIDRLHITHGHIGMPDLNTANADVQAKILAFLKECVDCGVDGFRFDAVKHIEVPNDPDNCKSDFWPNVLGGVNSYRSGLYSYGEILGYPGTPTSNYTPYMDLTDNYTGDLALYRADNQNASELASSSYHNSLNASNSVLWVESHDTYMGTSGSGGYKNTKDVSDASVIKAWAIVGSRANATNLFFARPSTTMGAASVDDTWKSKAVAEVNKFKNHFDGASEYLSSSADFKAAYNERGTKGVVISKLDGAGNVSLTAHQMADGTYTDQVSGTTFTVSGGTISGTVGDTGVAVVYDPEVPGVDYISTTPLYLKPSAKWVNGNSGDNHFAMYFFNNSTNVWVNMTAVGDGYYTAALPEGNWTNVIFCCMSGASSENTWSNKLYQTEDLCPPEGKDCFTIGSANSNNKYEGTWSVYTPYVPPATYSISVTNNAEWGDVNIYYWTAASNNTWPGVKMTKSGTDYTYDIPADTIGIVLNNGNTNNMKQTVNIESGIEDGAHWTINNQQKNNKYTVSPCTYYLVGIDGVWTSSADYAFEPYVSNEYKLSSVSLKANDEIKVTDSNGYWYPSSSDVSSGSGNYNVAQAGTYNVYFRPNRDGGDDWHYKYFCLKKLYTVTWKDGDGDTLLTETVEEGTTPSYTGETPTKEPTAQYSYTFNDTWSPAISAVTGDVTYTAQFDETVNNYTVTWVDGDGNTLATDTVAYGETPAYSGSVTPTKTADEDFYYTFNGTWAPEITSVTGDVTYTAQYDAEPRKYFPGNSLSLKGNIGVNFFVDLRGASPDNATVTLSWYKYTETFRLSEQEPDEDTGWYDVTCFVAAKEINDDITAVLTIDGEQIDQYTYSVATYAKRIIANEDGEFNDMFPDNDTKLGRLQELCKAMLHYGAEAQKVFSHNTENPADSDLGSYTPVSIPDDLPYPEHPADEFSDFGLTYAGNSLLLKDATVLRVFFTANDDDSGTTVWYNGVQLTPGQRRSYFYFDISGVKAADILKAQKLTFKKSGKADKAVDFYLTEYIKDKKGDAELADVLEALYDYNQKAVAYFP